MTRGDSCLEPELQLQSAISGETRGDTCLEPVKLVKGKHVWSPWSPWINNPEYGFDDLDVGDILRELAMLSTYSPAPDPATAPVPSPVSSPRVTRLRNTSFVIANPPHVFYCPFCRTSFSSCERLRRHLIDAGSVMLDHNIWSIFFSTLLSLVVEILEYYLNYIFSFSL